MLIGGDDISNDVITLATCFFNVCLRSRSFPLHADWRKSDSSVDREPQGNWSWNSNSRYVFASSPSFSRRTARASGRACSQAPLSRLSFSKEFLYCDRFVQRTYGTRSSRFYESRAKITIEYRTSGLILLLQTS